MPQPDLYPLIQTISAKATLAESVQALVDGVVGLLESGASPADVAAVLRAVDAADPSKLTGARQLAEALTVNTSHVACDPRDRAHVASLRLALTQPELDKAARIDDLEQQVSQAMTAHADAIATVATLQKDNAALAAQIAAHEFAAGAQQVAGAAQEIAPKA